MTYLFDVNALVAFGFGFHAFHARVALWLKAQGFPRIATCPITELGFVRVLAQPHAYGLSVSQARRLLGEMKALKRSQFVFIADDHDVSQLPHWVKAPKQIADGHLLALASEKGLALATLDAGIPGAFLIP